MYRRSIHATRIRCARDIKPYEIEGELIGAPTVGTRMLVVGDFGTHLVTSPIERVLEIDHEGEEVYVQTQNSVFRLVPARTRYPRRRVGAAEPERDGRRERYLSCIVRARPDGDLPNDAEG